MTKYIKIILIKDWFMVRNKTLTKKLLLNANKGWCTVVCKSPESNNWYLKFDCMYTFFRKNIALFGIIKKPWNVTESMS